MVQKPASDAPQASEAPFAKALRDYLLALELPHGHKQRAMAVCSAYDLSSASAHLIPSTPGYHTGPGMHRQGHMAMRALLSKEALPDRFAAAPVLAQCSSLGSLTAQWVFEEFSASLSAGRSPGGPSLQSPGTASMACFTRSSCIAVVELFCMILCKKISVQFGRFIEQNNMF